LARPYYSKIAREWHEVTGSTGGPLKKYVLNDVLLSKIGNIAGLSILELGAGNGYFTRLLVHRKSGTLPSRIVITDISGKLLQLGRAALPVSIADYRQLDVGKDFPFDAAEFDLVVATMVFNEIGSAALRRSLRECWRVLRQNGRLLATVTHPDFVDTLAKNGKLSQLGPEFWTMPGSGTLRVPVVPRSESEYESTFRETGFSYRSEAVYPSTQVLSERPGLRHSGGAPLALVYLCTKGEDEIEKGVVHHGATQREGSK